jgi:hypothetical protein
MLLIMSKSARPETETVNTSLSYYKRPYILTEPMTGKAKNLTELLNHDSISIEELLTNTAFEEKLLQADVLTDIGRFQAVA